MIEQFLQAVKLSEEAHRGQVRKGTDIAYFSHPLSVAADILGRGGSYNQAMAGLCHDILEDVGPQYVDAIRNLGQEVLDMVLDASDCIKGEGPKLGWYMRKLEYLCGFQEKNAQSFLVVLCDKLHNSNATIAESKTMGYQALTKFRAPPEMVVWYFVALTCELSKGAEQGYLSMNDVDDLRHNARAMIDLLTLDPRWQMESEEFDHLFRTIRSLEVMLQVNDPFTCQLNENYFGLIDNH